MKSNTVLTVELDITFQYNMTLNKMMNIWSLDWYIMFCTIFVEPVDSTVSTPKKNEMHSDVHVSLSTSNSKGFMGIILIIVDKELYDFFEN